MNQPTAIFNNENKLVVYSNCGFTDEFMEQYKDYKIVHNMAIINTITKYSSYDIITDKEGNIINAIPTGKEGNIW